MLDLLSRLRAEAGSMPVAAITYPPRAFERHLSWWPAFPWAQIARRVDAVVPMLYTGGGFKGYDATYGYVARSLRLLRAAVGDRVAVHAAGGVANRMTAEELRAFTDAVLDDGTATGWSLYDLQTTTPAGWAAMARLTATAGLAPASASRSRSRVASRCSGSTLTSARTGMKFVSPAQRGHDVLMEVAGDRATGGLAEVPPDVERIRPVDGTQRRDRVDRESMDVGRLVRVQLSQLGDVAPGRDHQVPGGVRKLVEQREGPLAARDDEARLPERPRALVAEHAGRLGADVGDVLEPPGCPQLLHQALTPRLPTLPARARV